MTKKGKFAETMANAWNWYRKSPVAIFITVMVIIFVSLVVGAYFAMKLGTNHNAERKVPDFVGLSVDDSNYYASKCDLQIVVSDSVHIPAYKGGLVLAQRPTAGSIVKPGRKIYVTINSMYPPKATVPYVSGNSLRDAVRMLVSKGFVIERLNYVDDDMGTNNVHAEFVDGIEVLESSNLQAYKGSGIVLNVGKSKDADSITMPQLMGLSLIEAKARLWELGLNVGEDDKRIPIIDLDKAKVCGQSKLSSTKVNHGETVTLSLTLDEKSAEEAKINDDRRIEAELKRIEEEKARRIEEARLQDSIAIAQKFLLDSVVPVEEATPISY